MRNLLLRYLALLFLVIFAFGNHGIAYSQVPIPPKESNGPTEENPPNSEVPLAQSTPRQVLIAFLDRMSRDEKQEAAELLDLSDFSPEAVAAKGPELAYQLYATMNRVVTLPIGKDWDLTEQEDDFRNVPDDADYKGRWPLSKFEEYPAKEAKQIEIVGDEEGFWKFSAETVSKIADIFHATEDLPRRAVEVAGKREPTKPFSVWYRELFPQAMCETIFLMPIYQWISLLAVALVCLSIKKITRRLLTWIGDKVLRRYDPDFPGSTAAVWKPIGQLLLMTILYYSARIIGLPLNITGWLLNLLLIVTIATAIWATFRIVDLVGLYLTRRAKRRESRYDEFAVPLSTTTAKVLATIVGILAATATFAPDFTTTVIGGLGIGGIAIALASQETISNFIGSLAVLFDRPFVVGDWVIVDGIEGEVESVGFRSTRIRTALSSQVSIPNSKLASTNVDNLGRRRYRRYLTRIGVEYDTTTEQIEAFSEGIHELIRRQPHTRKDFYAAYFNDFGDSALELILVCYFEVPDWATELRERQRLLLDIVRLAEQLEISFAFPTQTVHLYQEDAKLPKSSVELPTELGIESAAEIAGELQNYQDRPTKVTFPGPTNIATKKSRPDGS